MGLCGSEAVEGRVEVVMVVNMRVGGLSVVVLEMGVVIDEVSVVDS